MNKLNPQEALNDDLTFSEEQTMILNAAEDFCRNYSSIEQVRSKLDNPNVLDPQLWQKIVEMGWTGITIPEQFGGSGLGIDASIPIAESMGRYLLSTPFFSSTLAAQALLRGGNEQQQSTWLPKIASGAIGTLAMLENEDWGDDCIATTVQMNSAGNLQISGTKTFVNDACLADFFIVSAVYDQQLVWLIVDREQLTDQRIKPQLLIDETKNSGKVDFTGIEVSEQALMPYDQAVSMHRDTFLIGSLLTAAEAIGSCGAALDTIVSYLQTRKQFGRLIGSFQSLKHPTVDILLAMNDARSMLYHAATIIDDQSLSSDAEIACRMCKVLSTDALVYAGDRAVQFHGGMGFTYECDAQLYIRRAQWSQPQFGDAYHHRRRLAYLLLH